MFCVQCEQTMNNKRGVGCQSNVGVCGKDNETANLQDLLIYTLEGIGQYAHRARQFGVINHDVDTFIPRAFFTTLTNVNFDADRIEDLIREAVSIRETIKAAYEKACEQQGKQPETLVGPASWQPGNNRAALLTQADEANLKNDIEQAGDDIFGLRCLVLYGLKGTAAYCEHATVMGRESDEIYAEFHACLDFLASKPTDMNTLIDWAMRVGQLNLKVMELLDAAGTGRFGHPAPTQVRTTPVKGKAILVSGHDLVDLEAILKQTEGKGINVYTHGELLPAHAYPKLNAYPHLVGNYGGAWQDQQTEFAEFPGAIVMTSNCLIDPDVGGYRDRIFTSGPVGWNGLKHIKNHNFEAVIDCALAQAGFQEDHIERHVTVGFARNAVMSVADKVIDAVKAGDIKHFFLVGGCDGAASGRNYYSEFAEAAPDDTVLMTLGCGKYRFNKNQFGDIGGIPRLLDVGQCNDAYSAIQIAVALANAFKCEVNDLPLTLIISWFEQKAAAVLLTLLSLGIKNIHLGPSLPAYLTPNLLNFLVENFDLKPLGEAESDLKNILQAS